MKINNTGKALVAALTLMLCICISAEDIRAWNTDRLIRDLKSKDFQIRMKAVEALGKDINKKKDINEKTLDIFKKYIFVKTEEWKIKIKAIDILGTVENREVSDFLIKIVGDPFINEGCPAIKRHAIVALGKKFNNGSKAVDALIKALQEDNLIIKEAAIQSLGEIGNQKAVPYLIQGLDSESFAIRLSTMRALEQIGDIQAIPHLKRVAEKEEDPYLKAMAESLVKNFSSWIIFSSNKDLKK
jgi:HEAT repeat protein